MTLEPCSWYGVRRADGGRRELTQEKRRDLVPVLVLAGLVAVGLASWWLVPAFLHVVKHQDCVGSGRMDC